MTAVQLPELLRAIPDDKLAAMHARVVFVYETFLRSIGTQVLTGLCWRDGKASLTGVVAALESIRINLFSEDREAERARLIREGFGFNVPENLLFTPDKVKEEH